MKMKRKSLENNFHLCMKSFQWLMKILKESFQDKDLIFEEKVLAIILSSNSYSFASLSACSKYLKFGHNIDTYRSLRGSIKVRKVWILTKTIIPNMVYTNHRGPKVDWIPISKT